jgi:hypothetical protein
MNKSIILILLIVIGIILYFTITNKPKEKDMVLKSVIWNNQDKKETIVFVDKINSRLKPGGHVAIHNVSVISSEVPTEQVIFDLQAAAYHVTQVNLSENYFAFMLSAVNGVDLIDSATFSANVNGIAKVL